MSDQDPIQLDYATPKAPEPSRWWWLLRIALALFLTYAGISYLRLGFRGALSGSTSQLVFIALGLAALAGAVVAIRAPIQRRKGLRPLRTTRAWLAAGTAVLVLLCIGPIWQGIRILQSPARIRSQIYPRNIPTTGPYTDGELDAAAMDWRQLSGVLRDDIPRDELAPLAESRRRQEDFRQSGWELRKQSAASAADSRRTFGWLLITLAGLLMLIFTSLGLRALSSADVPSELPPGEETPPRPL